VAIVYEKHPLFCNNCKSIGHSIHQCQKLAHGNSVASKEVKKNLSSAINKHNVGKHGLNLTKKNNVAASFHAHQEVASVIEKDYDTISHTIVQADQGIDSTQIDSVVDYNIVKHRPDNSSIQHKVPTMVNATLDNKDAHKSVLSQTNPFDILHDLEKDSHMEALVEVMSGSLDSTDLASGVANNVSEAAIHTSSLDPMISEKNSIIVQHPMSQPITKNNTVLRPILAPSTAAQKSVTILKKFWGDYLDEDSDSNLDSDNPINLTGRYSISTPKHTKQKKQKNKLAAPSEGINTCSKKG